MMLLGPFPSGSAEAYKVIARGDIEFPRDDGPFGDALVWDAWLPAACWDRVVSS